MNKLFQNKNLIFIALMAFIASGFLIYGEKVSIPTQAAASDNVSGFAWSENIGWVSFNNTSDGSPVNYGVNIAANGDFSGYAWSENIGWISFNRSDTGNPPSNDPGAGSGPVAKYIYGTGQVLGWARALANGGGWDGWIRFDAGSSPVTLNASTGDFSGYAWGSDVVGWLSFNSSDAGAGGGPYKVVADINIPPSASSLQIAAQDYCTSSPSGLISFQWQYSDADGDNESQYQLQVDNNSNFSSPEVDLTQSLILPNPSNNARIVYVKSAPGADELAFNQSAYWWRAKVWDNGGADSGWVNGPASFGTVVHSYPSIDFTWNSANPSAAENIRFTDASTTYGGTSKTDWSWSFQDGNPGGSGQQNPLTTFITSGAKIVGLQVRDSDGFACTDTKTVNVQVKLPSWKEVKPK